ncbi:MAG: hypothetical protein FWE53_04390 [Firmicutes bacterium]|nr:hypothetical protein [Bacillota bacterium]
MIKILQLLVDDYYNQKPTAEYLLMLNKVCEAESKFTATLTKKQRLEYLKFEAVTNELTSVELDDFAKFLFKNLKGN